MSSDEWKKENTVRFTFRISNSSGIPKALKTMTAFTGESEMVYIRRVVTEALVRDGYLKEKKTKK